MKTLWWICPDCDTVVDFKGQLIDEGIFDKKTGNSKFDPDQNRTEFAVFCPGCKARWGFVLEKEISEDEKGGCYV